MPSFTKPPDIDFVWDVDTEITALQDLQDNGKHKLRRGKGKKLLIGTWNIANFDAQKRPDDAFPLIAEIIRPFDLVAIQEINTQLEGLEKLMGLLPDHSVIFTDIAGNEERMCYIYKTKRVNLTSHVGELDIPPSKRKWYKITFRDENGDPCIKRFSGFDRNPYVITWEFKGTKFTTYNTHIYFGKKKEVNIDKFRRRIVEIYSLVEWITKIDNRDNGSLYSPNIVLLGDMNVPEMKEDDQVFKQLNRGMFTPLDYTDYLTPYSNIKNDATYDQLVITKPFSDKIILLKHGIFAWDNAVFSELSEDLGVKTSKKAASKFQAFAKWAISDHRPLWCLMEF
ncbi:hypothetical protein [Nitrosopumilus adriaticus]|uniref:hypothetical protein n=1 Tax=Nitrosopumilus adriaticus TaxID=1580092 RepID=UPI00352C658F